MRKVLHFSPKQTLETAHNWHGDILNKHKSRLELLSPSASGRLPCSLQELVLQVNTGESLKSDFRIPEKLPEGPPCRQLLSQPPSKGCFWPLTSSTRPGKSTVAKVNSGRTHKHTEVHIFSDATKLNVQGLPKRAKPKAFYPQPLQLIPENVCRESRFCCKNRNRPC